GHPSTGDRPGPVAGADGRRPPCRLAEGPRGGVVAASHSGAAGGRLVSGGPPRGLLRACPPLSCRAGGRPRPRRCTRPPGRGRVRPVSGWTWLRTAATCVALVAIAVGTFGRTLAMDADWLPEREAAVFVKTHDLSGRLLTWFNYGEYAIWHFSPALRVSMDGRRETVYSEEGRDRHWRIYNNQPGAVEDGARLDPDYDWLPAA